MKQQHTKAGDCYESAANFVLARKDGAVLCHGTCTATAGPHEGKAIGHAWGEKGKVCFNTANGKLTILPKAIFYAIGQCRRVRRYTAKQTLRLILAHGHWGPWHTTNALHANDHQPKAKRGQAGKRSRFEP